jgi:hypothetical protein
MVRPAVSVGKVALLSLTLLRMGTREGFPISWEIIFPGKAGIKMSFPGNSQDSGERVGGYPFFSREKKTTEI